MCRRITNCTQKIWTESDNKIIFGTNIRTPFRHIGYLDIIMFLHIRIKIIQIRKDPTQTSYINLYIQVVPNFKIQKKKKFLKETTYKSMNIQMSILN